MHRWLLIAAVALVLLAPPVNAAEITGRYIEARTCDVYTGPCFANADTGLTGKHAVMAWRIDKGTVDEVALDGLSVVAVVAASETLGLVQTGAGKAVLIVDQKATPAQKEALIRFARSQGGQLLDNVVDVQRASIDLEIHDCKGGTCARLEAGPARIETRCLDREHDRGCSNSYDFYPPLAKGVHATAAVALEHAFSGKGFNETWRDHERRGAYVGTFTVR
jgi:hypothetical protein